MELFSKALKDVSINDIETIVSNKIPESRILDYKLELYPSTEAGNKEFLKDISAFANTVGGYLIYGINEEEGIPTDIKGIEVEDYDKLKLHFENFLRTAVEPPIRGVDFSPPINKGDSKKVIVIKVPKSIARPHGVKSKKHYKFFGRHSSGICSLDIDGLRRAFLASETLASMIRNFRNDRLAQIVTGEGHIQLIKGAKIVMHLIPVSAFELGKRYDLRTVSSSDIQPMINAGSWNHRYNFDGLVFFRGNITGGNVLEYTQLYHNGIIETVDSQLLCKGNQKEEKNLPDFEQYIVNSFKNHILVLEKLGVDFPVWVALSLLGVKGYVMRVGNDVRLQITNVHPIDRNELIIPEIQVEQVQVLGEEILRPAFDAIWNACGYERSFNYDENGNWKLRKE